jgi:surfactin synthase thioesterase subunit
MGALVGFEVIRLLERRSEVPVRRLFASGSNAPTQPRLRGSTDTWRDADILADLRRLGGTGEQLLTDEEALRMNLPALRADYRALLDYSCPADARIDAPITVVLGRTDPTTTRSAAERWREHTRASCDVAVVEGGHFFPAERATDVMHSVLAGLGPVLRDPSAARTA